MRFRCAVAVFATVAVLGASSLAASAGATPAGRRNPPATTYTLAFGPSPDAGFSDVTAVGDAVFFLNPNIRGGYPPGPELLVDQKTGTTIQVPAAGGCVDTLGPQDLLQTCTNLDSTTSTSAVTAMPLSGGPAFSLGAALPTGPVAVGSDWVQYAASPAAPVTFSNLATGQQVGDRVRVGGRVYTDLDSAALFQTACRPITVPAIGDSDLTTLGPAASLIFFGRTAAYVTQTFPSASQTAAFVHLQSCGSSRRTQIHTGAAVVHNDRVFVWLQGSGNAAEVAGIEPATRRRFAITIPANLLAAPDGLAINNDEIYLTTSRDGTLEAPLPAALR